MSHLNEQLSALVDGELTGAELDRVNGHLAACEQCRAETAALRLLKRELRGLATTRHSDELTRRLLSMAGPGGPVPPRRQYSPGAARPRAVFRAYPDRPGSRRSQFTGPAAASRPAPRAPSDVWARRRRGRTLTWGALSVFVTLGIGAGALSLGGVSLPSGARITPQMELYSIEHAFISGTIPMVSGPRPAPSKAPSVKWTPTQSPTTSLP